MNRAIRMYFYEIAPSCIPAQTSRERFTKRSRRNKAATRLTQPRHPERLFTEEAKAKSMRRIDTALPDQIAIDAQRDSDRRMVDHRAKANGREHRPKRIPRLVIEPLAERAVGNHVAVNDRVRATVRGCGEVNDRLRHQPARGGLRRESRFGNSARARAVPISSRIFCVTTTISG